MRPKTRMEKEVAWLSLKLPPLSEKQRKHAFRHCFNHCAIRSKSGNMTCSECGHSWQGDSELIDRLTDQVCPRCGEKLEVMSTRKRKFHDREYYSVITVCHGYQILRFFLIERRTTLGQPTDYNVMEVVQRWLTKDGKSVTVARKRASNCFYYDVWSWGSPMEVRSAQDLYAYDINPAAVWPYRSVLPEVRRNGYRGQLHGVRPYNFFKAILRSPHAETLLKAGQIEMFWYYANGTDYIKGGVDRYWRAVRIAIRNGYRVRDPDLWIDYLHLLERFRKDLSNAKYACPQDLREQHDIFVQKRNQEMARMEREREKKEMQQWDKTYMAKKGRYFGIRFSDGLISVHVLTSVAEFYEEGQAMHHCVYVNDYYMKDDSLILSATISGKRIETVEVSLQKMEVVQSRGKCNSNTEYHDRIIDLVNNNINQIRQIASI